jgi:NAD(P)H-nitrite reductase large subunit
MHHVIIGAGPAGVVAAEQIRALDGGAGISLVCGEAGLPYARMAIPYLLTGRVDEDGTLLRPAPDHYDKAGIDIRHGRVAALDPKTRRLRFADGGTLDYDRLLIATGARPIRPPIPGLDLPGVHTCWTLADARAIARLARPGAHVVLMGAGFIGCIVLEALAERGVSLTVVEMGDRMVPRMMNDVAGGMIKRWCEAKGVRVLTGTRIAGISAAAAGDELTVGLSDGQTLPAHLVVISAGVAPNVEFLNGSGIAMDRGVLVDERLRTSLPHVFAAGDVAQGPNLLGGREVHAVQPTAVEHGRIAALNMAGIAASYQGSLQMNVLDTLGLISTSFGNWMGVPGGDGAEAVDPAEWRYMRLEFDQDRLVGATSVGFTQHVGAIRGLIQTGVRLGEWKAKLMAAPQRVMEAYLARVGAAV